MADVVILGAGPAGLAAAVAALDRGRSVTVLEAADRVGGMAASITVAGQRVDLGSHRLHPNAPDSVLTLARRVLGADLQERPRHGRIRFAGRWIGFPLRATEMVRALPLAMTARLVADSLGAPLRRAHDDSFAETVRAGLGPTVAGEFYFPYIRKLWGVEPHELSGEIARRRVGTRTPAAVAARLVRPARRSTFLYPRHGYGQLSEALAGEIVARGGEVRLATPATRVTVRGDGVTVGWDGGQVDAERVWSTIPPAVLTSMLDPAPAGLDAELARLRYRAVVLVYLVLEQDRYTDFDAHYVPTPGVATARLSEPKNYRDSHDDPDGVTVLCAEVACWPDDATFGSDPEVLGATVREDLGRLGLPDPDPVAVEVVRMPRVYPVYDGPMLDAMGAVERALLAAGGDQLRLLPLGRQGLSVPDNAHHVMAMGLAAGAALRPDGFDTEAWRAARATFDRHVVED